MQNLSFSRPSPLGDRFFVKHGIYVLNDRADGSCSLDEVQDPYDGLLGESFSLDAQLAAGVPLQHVSRFSSGVISEVDKSNFNASRFLDQVNSVSNSNS